jgi:hypothetical protein
LRQTRCRHGRRGERVGDRIGVFDNDGTLRLEQPNCIQFIFAFDRLKSLAHAIRT